MLKMKPAIFIHVGLPKTATTAIQGEWAASAEELAAAGILYPQHGQVRSPVKMPGHHNLADYKPHSKSSMSAFSVILSQRYFRFATIKNGEPELSYL